MTQLRWWAYLAVRWLTRPRFDRMRCGTDLGLVELVDPPLWKPWRLVAWLRAPLLVVMVVPGRSGRRLYQAFRARAVRRW